MSGDELEVVVRVRGLTEESWRYAGNVIANHIVRGLYSLDGVPGKFDYKITVDGDVVRERSE